MKVILLICVSFLSVNAYSQNFLIYQTDNVHNRLRLDTRTGEVYQVQDDGQKFLVHPPSLAEGVIPGRYRLYKTKNVWTFILLDSFTGQLWQCQFSLDGDDFRSSWVINAYPLVTAEGGRFRIEPLVSMYQYYLIDDQTGDMWKFQWSMKGDSYRWIEKQ